MRPPLAGSPSAVPWQHCAERISTLRAPSWPDTSGSGAASPTVCSLCVCTTRQRTERQDRLEQHLATMNAPQNRPPATFHTLLQHPLYNFPTHQVYLSTRPFISAARFFLVIRRKFFPFFFINSFPPLIFSKFYFISKVNQNQVKSSLCGSCRVP